MIFRVVLTISVALLSACAAPHQNESQATSQSIALRESRLSAIDNFEFSGGLGIWTEQESLSARMKWQQSPEELLVNLSGPLGIGDIKLTESKGVASLVRGNVPVASGRSVDQVLQSGLGLSAPVPFEQLQLWVRGLPGDARAVVRDASGRLASLQIEDSSGTRWEARFLKYAQLDVENLAMPALVTASGGPYSVRVVLKNWQVATDSAVPEPHESNKRLPIPTR